MTYAKALSEAKVLKEALLDHGVRKVSIELVVGRGTAGYYSGTHVASMGHHIVSKRSQGDTPFLWLCKKGRVDLPGPICNGYGGFDEVARIICMGYANHSGRGGPVTVEAGTIPENSGRAYFFGWEFEGGIYESDWPDSMHEFMGACLAGSLDYLGTARNLTITEESHQEHKTWAPGRKYDRLGYTLEEARSIIQRKLEEAVVTRASKADDGLAVLKEDFDEAVQKGFATEHTQPGGVAFNDEILSMLKRMGLYEYESALRQLRNQIQDLNREVETLKNSQGSGGSLEPGTTFTAEVQ